MIANVEGTLYNVCEEHQRIFLPGQECSRCAQHQRDELGGLKAQVDDHYAELVQLRRRVVELEKLVRL